MYVQRFKNLATPGNLLGATLIGLSSLNVGCNGQMSDCIVNCKSELQALSEHGSHLVSAINEEGATGIDVASEPTDDQEDRNASVTESGPTGDVANKEQAQAQMPSKDASSVGTPVGGSAKASESLNGELGEKNFEEPSTFDKPEKILPKESPEWTTSKDKLTGDNHMLVVSTSTYDSREKSLENLPGRAYNRFSDYAVQNLGIDIKAFKEVTPAWVSERLIRGKDSEFVAEVMQNGLPTYVAWARLEIDAATRGELEGMNRRLQLQWRPLRVGSFMLSAIAFFGLAHVGFNLISSVQTKKK